MKKEKIAVPQAPQREESDTNCTNAAPQAPPKRGHWTQWRHTGKARDLRKPTQRKWDATWALHAVFPRCSKLVLHALPLPLGEQDMPAPRPRRARATPAPPQAKCLAPPAPARSAWGGAARRGAARRAPSAPQRSGARPAASAMQNGHKRDC
eukprot:gene15705-biopygen3703